MATLTADRSGGALGRYRFVATIFLGSFLLFLVQPMIARMALPRLGGAPSVWNSAMLVYQGLLLAGYAYAHWLGRLRPPRQAAIHLALLMLAGLALPIGLLSATPSPDANPFFWVPWLLMASIGPLFFVVSAQAPLLQRWFALTRCGDPYPLYAASNLGSFGGLIAYPLLVEPLMPLGQQRWLWSLGYGFLVLLVFWCAFQLPRAVSDAASDETPAPPPGWRLIGKWILLAAVPSGLILSTTLYITTVLIAMPLLWVLPLGAYLLSFTIAFAARRGPAESIAKLAPLMLLLSAFAVFFNQDLLAIAFSAVSIVSLFTTGVALHGRLFESRPAPRQLTVFYLAMSVGGVIGGIFCALVAPLAFDWIYEHLILLVAAAWLMEGRSPFDRIARLWNGGARARKLTIGAILLLVVLAAGAKDLFGLTAQWQVTRWFILAILAIAIVAIGNRALFTSAIAAFLFAAGGRDQMELSASPGMTTRSFFGIYSIREGRNDSRLLGHGTTVHGVQNLGAPERRRLPTSYYGLLSGVGLGLQATPALFGPQARVVVVGLGAGTLACYARPGEHWTFYEIDPAVVEIARDPGRFTFLSTCAPDAPIKIGDARLLIEREPAATADVLVVDAFTSDAVPMHLLTREAFAAYRRLLSDRGLLLVHISNRYLDLAPVVAAAASSGGWHARFRSYRPDRSGLNEFRSEWVALSPSRETIDRLVGSGDGWADLQERHGFEPWTDDHASVLPLIRLE